MPDELLQAELDRVRRENRELLVRCRTAEETLEAFKRRYHPSFALPYGLAPDALYKKLCEEVPEIGKLDADSDQGSFPSRDRP